MYSSSVKSSPKPAAAILASYLLPGFECVRVAMRPKLTGGMTKFDCQRSISVPSCRPRYDRRAKPCRVECHVFPVWNASATAVRYRPPTTGPSVAK